jgi:hypothetical protein
VTLCQAWIRARQRARLRDWAEFDAGFNAAVALHAPLLDAAREAQALLLARCDALCAGPYRDRGLHAPECMIDELGLGDALAALEKP